MIPKRCLSLRIVLILTFILVSLFCTTLYAGNEYQDEYKLRIGTVQKLRLYFEQRIKTEIESIMAPKVSALFEGGKLDQLSTTISAVLASQEAREIEIRWSLEFVRQALLPVVNRFAWAVPNDEAIDELAKLSPLIEIGAGSGYWAKLLSEKGAQIAAFDDFSWDKEGKQHFEKQWFDVQNGDELKILDFPKETLFLCFPPKSSPLASRALALYKGTTLAYIGEPRGGTTADDAFFDALEQDYILIREISIPNWPGYKDRLQIFQRK